MADVTTQSSKWQYTFHLTRDGEETTRVFSIDNPINSAAGVSAAKAFRDVFTGAASSPFSVIDPTQFIQPTGWRDEDASEPPWTTTAVYLKRFDTTETTYDGGGGGGGTTREITFVPMSDELDFRVEGLSASTDNLNYVTALVKPEGGTYVPMNRSNFAVDTSSNLFRVTDPILQNSGAEISLLVAGDSNFGVTAATYTVE